MRGTIKAKAKSPDSQIFEVSIALTLSDWMEFAKQIRESKSSSSYPAFHLLDAIAEITEKARNELHTEIEIS